MGKAERQPKGVKCPVGVRGQATPEPTSRTEEEEARSKKMKKKHRRGPSRALCLDWIPGLFVVCSPRPPGWLWRRGGPCGLCEPHVRPRDFPGLSGRPQRMPPVDPCDGRADLRRRSIEIRPARDGKGWSGRAERPCLMNCFFGRVGDASPDHFQSQPHAPTMHSALTIYLPTSKQAGQPLDPTDRWDGVVGAGRGGGCSCTRINGSCRRSRRPPTSRRSRRGGAGDSTGGCPSSSRGGGGRRGGGAGAAQGGHQGPQRERLLHAVRAPFFFLCLTLALVSLSTDSSLPPTRAPSPLPQ